MQTTLVSPDTIFPISLPILSFHTFLFISFLFYPFFQFFSLPCCCPSPPVSSLHSPSLPFLSPFPSTSLSLPVPFLRLSLLSLFLSLPFSYLLLTRLFRLTSFIPLHLLCIHSISICSLPFLPFFFILHPFPSVFSLFFHNYYFFIFSSFVILPSSLFFLSISFHFHQVNFYCPSFSSHLTLSIHFRPSVDRLEATLQRMLLFNSSLPVVIKMSLSRSLTARDQRRGSRRCLLKILVASLGLVHPS